MDSQLWGEAGDWFAANEEAQTWAAHEPGCTWVRPMPAQAHAAAWSNGRMLCVFSRPAGIDPWLLGRARMLHPDINGPDGRLGAAIRAALLHSRLRAEALRQLPMAMLSRRERRIRYLRWLTALMDRHGCRTIRSFLLHMQCCLILQREDGMLIVPSRHERIEGWSCLPQESALTLSPESGNGELGAALRQGFARCIDDYGMRGRSNL